MTASMPKTYWRVAWTEVPYVPGYLPYPDGARYIDYPEQWDAVAYYNVRRSLVVSHYNDSKDAGKRLEIMDGDMSTHWNCRAIHDGREFDVWLWRMEERE